MQLSYDTYETDCAKVLKNINTSEESIFSITRYDYDLAISSLVAAGCEIRKRKAGFWIKKDRFVKHVVV